MIRLFTFSYSISEDGQEVVCVRPAGPDDELTFESADDALSAGLYALDIERAAAKGPLAFLN
jgi:hypothetical protein